MKDSKIVIRDVQQTDYQALAEFLTRNNIARVTRHFHPFPLNSETAYRITYTPHRDRYYIVLRNKYIVGICMLRGWDEGYQIPSFGLIVDYKYQRHGVGKRMTEFGIEEARKLRCPGVRLSVYKSNIPAVRLFASLGFKETESKQVLVEEDPDVKIVMMKQLQ